jgi:hypothetical protein
MDYEKEMFEYIYKHRDLSPWANYTDRANASCMQSYRQLLRIEGCRVVSTADPLQP